MKTKILTAIVLTSLATSVWAVSYDQNVNDPGPGVFYGSGNANGGWTVDQANGIELGLRTKQRYPISANVYNSAGSGVYSWTDATGIGPANRATWNYDFSLATPSDLSGFTFALWIDYDPSPGHAWNIIDPSAIPDNATSGATYEQNSENPGFGVVGLPGYNKDISGTYDFVLLASDASGVLAKTYMRVNVNGGTASGTFDGNVPDGGSSLLLLGIALPGLMLLRRKLAN